MALTMKEILLKYFSNASVAEKHLMIFLEKKIRNTFKEIWNKGLWNKIFQLILKNTQEGRMYSNDIELYLSLM